MQQEEPMNGQYELELVREEKSTSRQDVRPIILDPSFEKELLSRASAGARYIIVVTRCR